MSGRLLFCLVGLVIGMSGGLRPAVSGAAPARLFPDVTQRFPTGDPAARNPIAGTEGPKTLVAVDLNADGLADVVAGNLDGSISVLLGRSNNTLADQILVPATGLLSNSSFRAVVVADFNGDGKPDVAAGDIAREGVVVLLGNGDGTLLPHRRTDSGPVRAMAAADFNHDDKLDLLIACSPPECNWCQFTVATNASNSFLCILRGKGDGTFEEPDYLLTPGTDACFYDVEAADMTGDGHPDVVALDFSLCRYQSIVDRTRRIRIFSNDGAGGFTTDNPQKEIEASGEGPRAIEVAYLDEHLANGVPLPGATLDLVVVNRDSATLDIYLNQGGLNFTNTANLSTGEEPRDVAVGDLDGDGLADLVVVDRDDNNLTVMAGAGGGQFDPTFVEYPTGVSPRQIALADINGDGVLDAAVNNRISEDISLFLGTNGLAGFLVSGHYYPSGVSPLSVVSVDFNHDGYPDVATANMRSHDVRVRLNLGNGYFGEERIIAVNNAPAILASGDLNGDGNPDLLVTCMTASSDAFSVGSGSMVTLLGKNDGTFHPPATTLLNETVQQPYWVRLGDMDKDGKLDAVIGGLRGELAAFRGRGNGTFDAGIPIALQANGRPLGIALGDFDENGELDIATSRGITVLNDGQFFTETNRPVPARTKNFNAGFQAWAIEAEDLDEDGHLDLMIALTFVRPDPIGVSFGDGQGNFTEPTIYEGPDVGVVAMVGTDMDGDGTKDIVVGNRCAATVIILRGLGNRTFDYREIIHAYSVEDVAVADLNLDGKPDIVGVGFGLWSILNGGDQTFVEPKQSYIFGLPERAGLFINEIMALNTKFHITNSATPDWVEIYNHTAVTQDLAGWSLSQANPDETNRWTFPSTNVRIPPWDHLVVYCKKRPDTNVGLYASFELSADGENLSLHRPGGSTEDSVNFPPMPSDVSYARFLDGARFFAYNPAPTIGKSNRRPANLDPSADRKDPYVGPGGSALGVNARFFDDTAIAYAGVVFRPVGSNLWDELPLNDDGLHGDKLAGDGYFGALLPHAPAGTTFEYYLRVIDIEGQSGSSPGDFENESKLHRLTVPHSLPSLRLTEVVAANNSGLRDERGQLEDWIELMNAGSVPESLDGLALSRDYYDHSSAWSFPTGHWLEPGERVVVYCDDDGNQSPLHASFKLQRTGDRIFLIQTNTWTIVDSLSFGPLPNDTSFGVIGNGIDAQWLAWPTPLEENIPMPPPVMAAAGGPRVFWRFANEVFSGTNSFALRWRGAMNENYRVDWSADLQTWQPSFATPANLGEGLYQWTDSGDWPRRFYRVVPAP